MDFSSKGFKLPTTHWAKEPRKKSEHGERKCPEYGVTDGKNPIQVPTTLEISPAAKFQAHSRGRHVAEPRSNPSAFRFLLCFGLVAEMPSNCIFA